MGVTRTVVKKDAPKLSGDTLFTTNNLWLKGRNAANSADLSMWRVKSDDYMDFGTSILRADSGTTNLNAWIGLRRDMTTTLSIGEQQAINYTAGTVKGAGDVTTQHHGVYSIMADATDVSEKTITAATNASPIAITATAHGFATGDRINVSGVLGNTAANGSWVITSTGANTFTLNSSTGNGAYTSGGIATNRPFMYGVFSVVYPRIARGGLAGTVANGDDVNCFGGYNAGLAKATDGFYLGRNPSIAGSEWTTGFTIDADCDYGIRVNGTMDQYGLDFYAGTYTTGMMRMKNSGVVTARNAADSADLNVFMFNNVNEFHVLQNTRLSGTLIMANQVFFRGRNAANTAEVNLFEINSINEFQVDAPSRWNNHISIGNTFNFSFSTATGTKFGTGTTQKIGFFNAPPIVQPSSTTDLRQGLIDLGFFATGGASPLNLNGGKLTAGTFQMTTSPTFGAIMTSDASGNGTWQVLAVDSFIKQAKWLVD